MKTISSSHIEAPYSFLSACCITFLVSLAASPTFAAATGPGDLVTGGCMQDIAGFELGCTANDVRVSGVADITDDGIVDENDITFRPVCDATAANAGTIAFSIGSATVALAPRRNVRRGICFCVMNIAMVPPTNQRSATSSVSSGMVSVRLI